MAGPQTDTTKLKQRNRELSILNSIAQALNREVDLSSALQTALSQAAELLGLDTGWIWLMREDTGESYLAAAQNLPPALAQNPASMEGSCYCLDTYRTGDLDGAANVNVVKCTRLADLVDGTDGLRYHASIPLYAPQGKRLGVLNVASSDWRELSPDDLRILYTFGDILSIAVERARLFAASTRYGVIEERNRLAREIHDTLAQGLAGIAMQLETADALLEAHHDDQIQVREAVQHALSLTRSSLIEARRSVLDLRAAPLEGRTLAEAIQMLLDDVAAQQPSIIVNFTVAGASLPLPVRIEAGVYRIAQEAITNVMQHAAATTLDVELTIQPEQLTLIITDDGLGFDPSALPSGRYGLVGLNERVNLLAGDLTLQSSPGSGTRLNISIPLSD